MANPEMNFEILIPLFIVGLVSVVFVLLMVNTGDLKSPYNKILNGIFVFGLIIFLLSLLLQYLGYVIADLLI